LLLWVQVPHSAPKFWIKCPLGAAVSMEDSQSSDRGSNPLGDAIKED
jgi:hypothetical protein